MIGIAPTAQAQLGIAVSGGGDSLALLLLAHAAYPGALRAVTVDHGLRPEATTEAAAVADICATLGITHQTLKITTPITDDGNLQERAREARYALLNRWAGFGADRRVEWVAIAHQQDDVAEGFLMRARRGAGVGGLAAMAAQRAIGPERGAAWLLRPLLDWSRAELAAVVRDCGLTPMHDPSNGDPKYDRARIRKLIAESGDLPADRLAMSARNLRDAESALEWAAEQEWRNRSAIERHESVSVDMGDLPHELRRRLAGRAIEYLRREAGLRDPWRGTGIDRLVRGLEAEKAGTLAGIAARPGRRWVFRIAPPRQSH
ncbi:tRNA lysidine(34) synthetase TilS [Stakelama sediminis]|uniref:tRNA lysidine(34) synthetase TilS n=1 Tax=Stakelama sediminis TaxID=463200 RepID=UPI001FE59A8D|nr:tRNA lysidine(34) synthetase TilS [Stakelama sediminis]